MKRRLLAGILAIMMVSSFASCGDTGSSASGGAGPNIQEETADKKSSNEKAPDVLKAEIEKLKGSPVEKEGTIKINFNYDAGESDTKLSWDNIAELSSGKVDAEFAVEASWKEDKTFDAKIDALGGKLTEVAFDGTSYYIDLTQLENFAKIGGSSSESLNADIGNGHKVKDLFTTIKIEQAELDGLKNSTNLNVNTDKLKSGISDDTINALKELADKAEYDGDAIVVKDISKEDAEKLTKAIKSQLKSSDEQSNILDSLDTDSSTDESSDTEDTKMEYRLEKHKTDGIGQTHKFIMTRGQNKVEISIEVSDTATIDETMFSKATTIEEISGGQLTFSQLVQSILMNMNGNGNDAQDTPEYKYDEDGNLTFDYNGETYTIDRTDE